MNPNKSSLVVSDPHLSQTFTYSFNSRQNNTKTFIGRFMHFQRVVDPRNFFVTQSQLNDSISLVKQCRQTEQSQGRPLLLSKIEYDKLQRAISIVNSAILPDTQEQIPRFMRMCAFVPVNIPILFGMLISSPTTFNTIFWQWFNQSFNAGLNYGNRNGSSLYTTKDLAYGYSAAVGSSVSVALILRKLFANVTRRVSGSKLILINAVVSSIAGGCASFLNTFCMRRVEMENGIEVFADQQMTQKIGTSKICAQKAILETASSRVFLAVACLMSPAFIFYAFEVMKKAPKTPKFRIPYEIGVFVFALMVGLPASIAMFPQTGSLQVDKIESILQKEIDNQRVSMVYYNKGL